MILFWYGQNSFEARHQIARLSAQYQAKVGSDIGLERLDGAKITAESLRAALLAMPFLVSSRLVIVEGLGANKTVAPKIEQLITDIPPTTVAVFYDPAVDQRTSYFKTLSKLAQTTKFELLDGSKLQRWVQRTVSELGGQIERPALGRLLELTGGDQWRLSNEIAKLINLGEMITLDMVQQNVAGVQDETVFNLVDAVTASKPSVALASYHELRQDGHSEVYILSMIIWQLRNLLLAKSAGKITSPQLAKDADMSPFVAGKMLSKRHLFSERQLEVAFIKAVETDYQIKSGESVGEIAVEQLILKLARQPAA